MKRKKLFLLIALLGIVLSLGSCAIDDPIHDTDHPDHGKITLTVDWGRILSGQTAASSYHVSVGGYTATLTGTTNTIDNLFVPGTYRGYVYNTSDGITVSGTTASVSPMDGIPSGNYFANNPGWFFTSVVDATIEKGKNHDFTAVMISQVREITFTVTPSGGTTDKIATISGTLGGIAGSMNIETDARSNSGTVILTFAKQANGTWQATIRVLGIVGAEQLLTTTVTFTQDSGLDPITDETNIHDPLEDHYDGTDPNLNLGTEIIVTPTGATFTSTIIGWTVIRKEYDVTG